jgi:hypothetical protein
MPAIDTQLDATGRLIKGLAALLSLFPAIALLFGLVDIPPSLSHMIKALSFFVSLAVLLSVVMLGPSIQKMKRGVAVALVIGTVLIGSISAISYWVVAENHVLTTKGLAEEGGKVERIIIPLNPSARVQELVRPFRGDYREAVYTGIHGRELHDLLDKESTSAIILMLVLLLSANVLLVLGVVIGAWKIAASMARRKPGTPAPAPAPVPEPVPDQG